MKKILTLSLVLVLGANLAYAQKKQPKNDKTVLPTPLADKQKAVAQKEAMRQNSIFQNYPIRSVGPTVMGGRVVDVEASAKDRNTFYVAYASGGVFKTTNNAQSFEPIFDGQARLTVGDIALSPADENLLWVGTGENNSSRSSYAGFGVYKSTDAGKTWAHMGLENTQHIGRIVAHPQDAQTAWVASIGALYSNNAERGVYKTTDGGKTWKKTLFVNDSTGVIDLLVNPQNPKQLWATAWERTRKANHFKGHGKGSGLYMSEDGGETWAKITQGLPAPEYTGRMGVAICDTKPNILYVIVDNQQEIKKPQKDKDTTKLVLKDFAKMLPADVQRLDDKKLESFLRDNGFPDQYTASRVKQDLKENKYTTKDIANYFGENANENLFETEVIGAELYRSEDAGKTWQKTNAEALEGLFYTYGYYFGQVRIAPKNPEQVYIFGVPVLRSDDGGKTFKSLARLDKVHADHHALWIDATDNNRIILGNDGGLYLSYDAGEHFTQFANVAVGQFYTVAVDMETPYNIYGGLQDNGVYFGSSQSVVNDSPDWEFISGGDGMFVQVHPKNNKLRYTGYQFGNYNRFENGKRTNITPEHAIGESPYRFNWRTPLILSKHNPDVVYFGTQKVLRSLDKGDTWEVISPDLTYNHKQGTIPYSTISALAESPLKFGLLWAGTDDGRVQVSNDAGATWQAREAGLPTSRWVSSVFPSPHTKSGIFVTLTGYRYDETKAYIYYSANEGQTWTSIVGNLPDEAVNSLVQDAVNPNLLYAGTDEGAYISLDFGKTWHVLSKNFPNVAVYDMLVHPRENELILATHGRSMYVLDAKPLQQMTTENLQKNAQVFAPSPIKFSRQWGKKQNVYTPTYEPKMTLLYYLKDKTSNLQVEVRDSEGKLLKTLPAKTEKGFQTIEWNLKNEEGKYLAVGEYSLTLKGSGFEEKTALKVTK
ncbi:MAG: glycosyl hydrolase [Bacteroidetes bacterium]|nr:MAG: glycosyl hydrolase [Bacteroidota bacterium]